MEDPKLNQVFDISTQDRLGYTLFQIKGSFSVKNLFHVRTRLQELVEESVNNIVFDFETCKEIDSSGLGILSNLYKKLGNQGGELGIMNVSPEIAKILSETGLESILTFFNTLDDADAHFD